MVEKVYANTFKYPTVANFGKDLLPQDENENEGPKRRMVTVEEVDRCAQDLLQGCLPGDPQ